ncbi:unnamed protein product [Triticum turgidum subsp. durum]|uniref:Protein ABIL2 n=1 Tax=Triticum turgidum subsp. durum TaxID=4567 RepID=A0A9R1QCR0_TRITD|nr:unnamed protein product [Triticum turgidum subsp. durum]
MEAVAMSPSSVSSRNLDAASTSDDMPSSQEGLLFSDSLKDLRNLRSQLYSAAEYFEVFYTNNSHRSTVVTSLKDYAVEALVSTVDHLGFVSYKVDNLVNEKADEVNETEFRVSSVEQIIVVPLCRRRYSGIRYPSGFRAHTRQTSMQVQSDYENQKEREKKSNKGRGFLKSLLTRRRWRNDESLYNYLDEY